MKKEVIIAIIIGFGLGLVITFGIWKANKSLQGLNSQKNQLAQLSPSPTKSSQATTPTPESFLTITSPENDSIVNQEKIEVAGKTTPETTVIVIFNEGEEILQSDKSGGFSAQISLSGGSNEITVYGYDKDGNESVQKINLVYSTAEI